MSLRLPPHSETLDDHTGKRKSFIANSDDEYTDESENSVKVYELDEKTTIVALDKNDSEVVRDNNTVIDVSPDQATEFTKAVLSARDKIDSAEDAVVIKASADEHLFKVTKVVKRLNVHRYKNGVPRSNFADVKYSETSSILDSEIAKNSDFWGWYTPFWLAIAFFMMGTAVKVTREFGVTGAIKRSRIIQLLVQDIVWVGLCDLVLYLNLYLIFFLHWAIKRKYISWSNFGWHVQSLYEVTFLVSVVWWIERSDYRWIGKVFLVLHSLVLLMKMHSFGFYNGYLWKIQAELNYSERFLKKYDNISETDQETLTESVNFCRFELESSATDIKNRFPNNVTIKNFFWFTMYPTLVYQVEYPHSPRIRWKYLFTKVLGIFGIIGVMIGIAQSGLYPLAMKAIQMREWSLYDRVIEYPFLLLDMVPYFFLLYILVFFLIWELILNSIAELTRFSDRDFYGPWWNCVTWDEFARRWNAPVHKFLLRHVYHSSISALNLSKHSATLMTFVLSAAFHELVMYVIFGKLRCYLFFIQMYQLPLVAISRTKFFRDLALLGNIVFWFGIATGAALVCSLYLMF